MGVNWAAGLIRWRPHKATDGTTYPLNHLHPFRAPYELPAAGGLPARSLILHVGFSLHTFTRDKIAGDDSTDEYCDNREIRTFDYGRYALSKGLPEIIRDLDARPCQFAVGRTGSVNFVTVDLGQGVTYGVFFDLMRWAGQGPNAILLMVQSAYELDPAKGNPGKGRISFKVLMGHVSRGTKPKRPP